MPGTMARTPLRPDAAALAAALLLTLTGCGEADGAAASVTMKLPPPRPADARPGFSALDEKPPQKLAS